ncbi:Predicted DNA-binding transcriptional regulator YafY, contains an HTH and WYL domains [Paenibacillus sp. UNCCL117]|uniref:helix-turn-helix transcriptional regulator n=1 Tax=unclassified Paenibacillus TaxID=185978 RepID=UPI00088D68DC|nr:MULTISPECIES: WYL domain-containing protein [unclassified Paenibacillus]SDE47244.1 Predicted DNA-binding transcriptional regulator YafY, contains an HTH and WYL domains [Paenibacillus sp. cl123]SFW65731.1 Predicted DNA-binding transcriptional regulator YafY, contains an HTH and WYL domains [Paenibacillus sp. UNCCL117]
MRVLQLYDRLLQGACVSKRAAAEEFGVATKTIQRDLRDLNLYLAEAAQAKGRNLIRYQPSSGGYVLEGEGDHFFKLASREVMVVAKIILESRALPKNELDVLLDKLIAQAGQGDKKRLADAINNERFLYRAVSHNRPVFDSLWELNQAVRERRIAELVYEKTGASGLVERTVEPLGLMFSEFYFYLIANIHSSDKAYPAIYRLDRIRSYQVTDKRFSVRERERFQEGQFRQKIQFMQSGELLKVVFRFWGPSIEAVVDKLPDARIIQDGDAYLVEAEVFGRGIQMWLLSQGPYVEVLKPRHFREQMIRTIEAMRVNYGGNSVTGGH